MNKFCTIENCNKEHEGLGFCNLHYKRFKKYGDPNKTAWFEVSISSFNKLYARYKLNAEKRNLEFNLNKEDFKILTKDNCYYCNCPPSTIMKANGNKSNRQYIYNGIDRLDSNLGYDIINVVTCCKTCNTMKGTLSKDDFLEKVELIYNQQKEHIQEGFRIASKKLGW